MSSFPVQTLGIESASRLNIVENLNTKLRIYSIIPLTTKSMTKVNRTFKMHYLSFIRIRTLPASSLALDSTTDLPYSLSLTIILSIVAWSRSNVARAEANPEVADSVSR